MKKKNITLEALEGRGFFHFSFKESDIIQNDNTPENDEVEEEDKEVTCKTVRETIKSELYEIASGSCTCLDYMDEYFFEKSEKEFESIKSILQDCWIKCLPVHDPDLGGFFVICLKLKNENSQISIESTLCLRRFHPSYDSIYFEMAKYRPSTGFLYDYFDSPFGILEDEVDMLVKGRYLPIGFTFEGKPMPKDKKRFHSNPDGKTFTLVNTSGYRRVCWHLSIEVDENDIIQCINYSTRQQVRNMFARTHFVDDDEIEEKEANLFLCDLYSDKEWDKL